MVSHCTYKFNHGMVFYSMYISQCTEHFLYGWIFNLSSVFIYCFPNQNEILIIFIFPFIKHKTYIYIWNEMLEAVQSSSGWIEYGINELSWWFSCDHLILDPLDEPGLCSLTHAGPQQSALHPGSCSRVHLVPPPPPRVSPCPLVYLPLCPPLAQHPRSWFSS